MWTKKGDRVLTHPLKTTHSFYGFPSASTVPNGALRCRMPGLPAGASLCWTRKHARLWPKSMWRWGTRGNGKWGPLDSWVWVNTYRYILVGWTSIYQLFWGSLGTRVLTHSQLSWLISPITMVYGRYNELVNGAYKPTYNWGAPPCGVGCWKSASATR